MLVEIYPQLFVAEHQIQAIRVVEVQTAGTPGSGLNPPTPPVGTGTYKVQIEVNGRAYILNHAAFASIALAETYIKSKFTGSVDVTS